jgi:rubrerythrin
MAASPSVDDLIQIAIQAERARAEFYRRLTRLFAHVTEIARFIERYAAEEASHVVWLETLRGKLTPEKLAAPAIPLMYQDALHVKQIQVEERLQAVETLDDAYHLIVEVVNGEANQLLSSLINTFYEDETTRVFLMDHLRQHIDRISQAFPEEFDTPEARKAVVAVRGQ